MVVTVLGAAAATGMGLPAAGAVTPVHWRAAIGASSSNEAVQANAFLPAELWVDAGDTIDWTLASGEFHTLTFLAGQPPPPFVIGTPTGPDVNPVAVLPAGGSVFNGSTFTNSGLLVQGQQYSLGFSTPGTYSYVCLIHSDMSGVVHVQPAGAPYPRTQRLYDVKAAVAKTILLAEGRLLQTLGLLAARHSGAPAVTTGTGRLNGNGTSLAVMRFLPGDIVIHSGQTVTWTNRDPETPHTITFGTEPQGGPFAAFLPSGGNVLDAPGDSVNSGFIGQGFGPTTFSATFTAPGTYTYICALHDDLGMTGQVVVLP